MEKVLLISLKPNVTPNTLGCYGLTLWSPNRMPLTFRWQTAVIAISLKDALGYVSRASAQFCDANENC